MANLKQKNVVAVNDMDILETKLELARAYLEMGDLDASNSTLNNVLHDDNFDFDFDFFDMGDSESVKLILKDEDYINFSTPKKIAELIESIAAIYKPNSVIDICCGYGNILSCFKHLQNVKGIEINSKVIKLAKHINSNIDFIVADTLKYDFGNIKYDLVVGNLPFDKNFSDCQEFRNLFSEGRPNCKILDIELMEKGLSLLNKNGIAIFIVPENLFLASSKWENKILSKFRRELLSNFALDMVISLPYGTFRACASTTKTSVLVIRNGDKKQDVFMPEFKNNSFEIADNFKQHKGDFYFPTSKFTDKLDRNHYLWLEIIEKTLNGCEVKKLGDIAEIISGKPLNKDAFKNNGNYLVFNRRDNEGNNFVDNIPNKECVLKSDDIVICLNGINNKISFYKNDGVKTVINHGYVIIRPKNNKYITTYFQTENGIDILKKQISLNLIGAAMPHLPLSNLRNFDIPIIEFSEPEKLFSEQISDSFILSDKRERFLRKNAVYLFVSSKCLAKKEYDSAKEYVYLAFELADKEDNKHKDVYLDNINKAEELEEKNKQLELEIQQKESALEAEKVSHKKLHEKEQEMISFFTHTLRNALASAPESLRQVIRLLGSEDYEKNKKYYKAINKITALFSTLSLTDCLIDTFKQSINDPQEFKLAWQKDNTGDATPKWVIASALRQSLNRIIFMSDASQLEKLLNVTKTSAIVSTRKSFIETVLPLNIDNQGINAFYDWLNGINTIEISIEETNHSNFGINQVKFSLLFAITSEILLNALKYWNGTGHIQISWQLIEENYIFTVKNPCHANASSNLVGTHKGIAFINRLMELLGDQAHFNCIPEEQLFTAQLKLHKSLLGDNT